MQAFKPATGDLRIVPSRLQGIYARHSRHSGASHDAAQTADFQANLWSGSMIGHMVLVVGGRCEQQIADSGLVLVQKRFRLRTGVRKCQRLDL